MSHSIGLEVREAGLIEERPESRRFAERESASDGLVANAKRSDWLFVLGDTIVPAEVINANPELNGIGALSRTGGNIEMAWLGP